MIYIEGGNILKSREEFLVNPVNCVGVMGAGLAKQFKELYPAMYEDYRWTCLRERLYPGTLHIHPIHFYPMQYVINFPTKVHWKSKSTLEIIENGLVSLRDFINTCNMVHSIAIPKIGCGLGGLDWDIVNKSIETILKPCEDLALLYLYI